LTAGWPSKEISAINENHAPDGAGRNAGRRRRFACQHITYVQSAYSCPAVSGNVTQTHLKNQQAIAGLQWSLARWLHSIGAARHDVWAARESPRDFCTMPCATNA